MTPQTLLLILGFSVGVLGDLTLKDVAHGHTARAGQAPWHAGVYKKKTTGIEYICGGNIISHSAILTAAHCFTLDKQAPMPSNYAVAAGKLYSTWNHHGDMNAQKSNVAKVHIPPRYQGAETNFQDDIAVVILATRFTFNAYVRRACLNFDPNFEDQQLRHGQLGKIAGWGRTGAFEDLSSQLMATKMPMIDIRKCIDEIEPSFRSSITGDKICAGYTNGTAVCSGDSGGGLVFSGDSQSGGRNYLRGLVSASPRSAGSCNVYTWALFTHVLRHEHFIKSILPDVDKSCSTQHTDVNVVSRASECAQALNIVRACQRDKRYRG